MVTLSFLHHEIDTSLDYCHWLMPRDDIIVAFGIVSKQSQHFVRSASAAAEMRPWTN